MARLEFQASKRTPVILGGQVVVGRSADYAEVVIQDKRLSRRHCEFFEENGSWFVRDLKSANGTRVNGAEILEAQVLKENDEVSLGGVLVRFSDEEAPAGQLELEDSNRLELDDEPAPAPSVQPVLKVITGTLRARLIKVDDNPFSIGRREGNNLVLIDDSQASSNHAEIFLDGSGDWRLRDLGSTNGTRVNGKVATDTELEEGARIQIGAQLLSFSLLGEDSSKESVNTSTRKLPPKDELFDDQGGDELEMLDSLDDELSGEAETEGAAEEVRRLEHAVIDTQGAGKGKMLFRSLEVVTLLVVLAALAWLFMQISETREEQGDGSGDGGVAISDGRLLDLRDDKDDHKGYGSFERKGATDLYGWTLERRDSTDSASFVTGGALDGLYRMEINRRRSSLQQSRWLRDRYVAIPLEDGKLSEGVGFSIQYKRGATQGVMAFVFLEWFNDARESSRLYTETRGFVAASEEWQELSGDFRRPEGAKYFRFGVGVAGGVGQLSFDQASVFTTKPKSQEMPSLSGTVGSLYIEMRPDAALQFFSYEHARNVNGVRGATLRRVEYFVNANLLAQSIGGSQTQLVGEWMSEAPRYMDDAKTQTWTFSLVDALNGEKRSMEVRWDGLNLTLNDQPPVNTVLNEIGFEGLVTQEFMLRDAVVNSASEIVAFGSSLRIPNATRLRCADMQGARDLRFETSVMLSLDARRMRIATKRSSLAFAAEARPLNLMGDQDLIDHVSRSSTRRDDLSDFEREVRRTLPAASRSSEDERSQRVEAALTLAKNFPFDSQALRFAAAAVRDVVDFYRERMDDVRALVNEGGDNAENPDRFVASILEAKAFAQGLRGLHERWGASAVAATGFANSGMLPQTYKDAHRAIAEGIQGIALLAGNFDTFVAAGHLAAYRIESRRQAIDAALVLESAKALLADGETVQALLKLQSIPRRFAATIEATQARELLLDRAEAILAESEHWKNEGLMVVAAEKQAHASELASEVIASSNAQLTYAPLDIADTYNVLGGQAWIGVVSNEWKAREAEIRRRAGVFVQK